LAGIAFGLLELRELMGAWELDTRVWAVFEEIILDVADSKAKALNAKVAKLKDKVRKGRQRRKL